MPIQVDVTNTIGTPALGDNVETGVGPEVGVMDEIVPSLRGPAQVFHHLSTDEHRSYPTAAPGVENDGL
jgi:hypothetical protein